MSRIVILTGAPGAGKTTLAERLAARAERGVHVRADVFYTFVAHPIAPVLPESRAQNETVIRAAVRTAVAFARGGYEVFLDGIFGPWFLPLIADELAPTGLAAEYVVLQADLDRARARAVGRTVDPAPAAVVEQMHRQLADLGPYAGHAVQVGARAADEVLAEIDARRAAGDFRLAFDDPR
jgi:predicted kinase